MVLRGMGYLSEGVRVRPGPRCGRALVELYVGGHAARPLPGPLSDGVIEHLSAAGIVAVGGAGNYSRLRRGKEIALPKDVPCVITAAGITRDGRKADESSEGPCTWDGVKFYEDYPLSLPLAKPDVTGVFGGFPRWARPENGAIFSKENDQMALVDVRGGNSFTARRPPGSPR